MRESGSQLTISSRILISVLLLGTSKFAVELADVLAEVPGVGVSAFVENRDKSRANDRIDSLPVIWKHDLSQYRDTHGALCGLGTTRRSIFIKQATSIGMNFATAIHPSARISSRSTLDEGCIASVGTIVASQAQIGRHVLLNRRSIVGHHAQIGDCTSVMSGANIGGNAHIGEGVYVGMGSIVLNDLYYYYDYSSPKSNVQVKGRCRNAA